MLEYRHATITEYGCTQCQKWHRNGDALYEAHLIFQSKHGVRERPDPDRFVPPDDPEAYVPPLPRVTR